MEILTGILGMGAIITALAVFDGLWRGEIISKRGIIIGGIFVAIIFLMAISGI